MARVGYVMTENAANWHQRNTRLGRKGDLLRIVQEIKILPWYKHKPESILENERQYSLGLSELQKYHPIPTRLLINKKIIFW